MYVSAASSSLTSVCSFFLGFVLHKKYWVLLGAPSIIVGAPSILKKW